MHASSSQHRTAPTTGENDGGQPPGTPAGTRINMTWQSVTSVPRPLLPGNRRAAWTIGDSPAITGRGAQITGLYASEVDRICRIAGVAHARVYAQPCILTHGSLGLIGHRAQPFPPFR